MQIWLEDYIADQVQDLLRWFRNPQIESNTSLPNEKRFKRSDNGFKIICDSIPFGDLQVIEVLDHQSPVITTLTDYVWTITAKFTQTASDVFRQKAEQNVGRLQSGSLIRINKLEIQLFKSGDESKRLTLLIHEFILVGSNTLQDIWPEQYLATSHKIHNVFGYLGLSESPAAESSSAKMNTGREVEVDDPMDCNDSPIASQDEGFAVTSSPLASQVVRGDPHAQRTCGLSDRLSGGANSAPPVAPKRVGQNESKMRPGEDKSTSNKILAILKPHHDPPSFHNEGSERSSVDKPIEDGLSTNAISSQEHNEHLPPDAFFAFAEVLGAREGPDSSQQKLLSKPESWQYPDVGDPLGRINLPAQMLEHFQDNQPILRRRQNHAERASRNSNIVKVPEDHPPSIRSEYLTRPMDEKSDQPKQAESLSVDSESDANSSQFSWSESDQQSPSPQQRTKVVEPPDSSAASDDSPKRDNPSTAGSLHGLETHQENVNVSQASLGAGLPFRSSPMKTGPTKANTQMSDSINDTEPVQNSFSPANFRADSRAKRLSSASPLSSREHKRQRLPPSPVVSNPTSETQDDSKRETLFRQFKAAYPKYDGEIKHFSGRCRALIKLYQRGMIHSSLSDEFVGFHKAIYIPYTSRCAEQGDDPIPYEKYFLNERPRVPRHNLRILEVESLKNAFGEDKYQDSLASTTQEGRHSSSYRPPYKSSPSATSEERQSSTYRTSRRHYNQYSSAEQSDYDSRSTPRRRTIADVYRPNYSQSTSNEISGNSVDGGIIPDSPEALPSPFPWDDVGEPVQLQNPNHAKKPAQETLSSETPYGSFVKQYTSLKSMHGALGAADSSGTRKKDSNPLSVLSWNI